MSKRGYIYRYSYIIKKLKTKPYSTFEEIQRYVESRFDDLQMRDDTLNVGFSKRTLQRDIKEMRSLFGIDVMYSKSAKGYYINQTEMENMNFQRMIETFDIFNSLNLAEDLTPFVHPEKRRPQGTENLYGIIHAIKNKLKIKFTYQKFWEEKAGDRSVSPYALKEFRNRWYVLARDDKDGRVKSFALDRLSDMEITTVKIMLPTAYNMEENYRYCFGIISPNAAKPEEIILSFTHHQGKYIKTLPLHETQEIIKDNEDELQVALKLYITDDFIMELLSYGEEVKVLKPASLAKEIKSQHQRAFAQY